MYSQSYSFQERWNSLTNTQKVFVSIAGVLLLYAVLGGVGIFGRLSDPRYLATVGMIIFITFPVHEFAHAAMAVQLGDETPRLQGRYTLNPAAHIDPMGAVLLLFTMFGWAKPVQWRPGNVDIDPKIASILVSLAGPVSNLLLAVVALIIKSSFLDGNGALDQIIDLFVLINVLLFVFNMIPVPPLDGSHILFALMPGDLYQLRAVFSQYGFLILMVIIFMAGEVIFGPTMFIVNLLERIFLT